MAVDAARAGSSLRGARVRLSASRPSLYLELLENLQVHGYQMAQSVLRDVLKESKLGHADEFETSLLLHLTPDWVAPLEMAGEGSTRASQLRKRR